MNLRDRASCKAFKPFGFNFSDFSVTTSIGTVTLLSLAIPIFLEVLMNNLLGTVNTAVLSNYSEQAAAAVGTANTVLSVITVLVGAIAGGSSAVISNYIGAENLRAARKATFTIFALAITMTAVFSAVLLAAEDGILTFMNLEGGLLEDARIYFRFRVIVLPLTGLISVSNGVMRCYGYPKYTIITGVVMNIMNLLLNLFVTRLPQYSPVIGVEGVSCSYVISQVIGFACALSFIRLVKIKTERPESMKEFFRISGKILGIGIPTGCSALSYNLSLTITTSFVALLGDYALSAKIYFTNILNYVFLVSMTFGQANQLLVGRLCGMEEYDRANEFNRNLVKFTVVVNMVLSLTVLLLRVPLLHVFTHDGQIISLALGVMLVDIITEQSRAVSQVYEYALKGAGDVLFTLIVVIISGWVCGVGLSYVFTIVCGFGIKGIWMGIAADETVRAISTYCRWRTGKWRITSKNIRRN